MTYALNLFLDFMFISEKKRNLIAEQIKEKAICYTVELVDEDIIDKMRNNMSKNKNNEAMYSTMYDNIVNWLFYYMDLSEAEEEQLNEDIENSPIGLLVK